LVWPKARAAEMVAALAAVSRLPVTVRDNVGVTDIERIAARLDLEAEAVGASYASVEDALKVAGPALVRLDDELVALVGARGHRISLVGVDRVIRTVDAAVVRDRLCAPLERTIAAEIDAVLEEARVPAARRARARRARFRERL